MMARYVLCCVCIVELCALGLALLLVMCQICVEGPSHTTRLTAPVHHTHDRLPTSRQAPAAKAYKKKEEDEHLRRTLIAALRARDIYVPRRTSLMSVLSLAASVHPLSSSSDTDRAIAALIRHHLWRLRMDRARRLSTTTSPSSTIDPAVLTDRVESLQDQLFALRRRFGAAIDKCASYQKLVDALQAQFDLTPEKGAPPEWRWRTGFRLGSLKQAVLDQQGKERGLSRRMTAVS